MWHWRFAGAVHEQMPASKPVSAGSSAEIGASLHHEDYAGIVSRLVAVAIDVAVLTVAAAAAAGLVLGGAEVVLGDTPGWLVAATSFVLALLPTLYFTLGWWILGQTAGGLAMGIAVRRAGGRPLHFPRALVRAVLGLSFAVIWLIGMALVLVDQRRRALIDVVTGTEVVYVPERGAQP
jgi:uncharacterized RDD family membrane protein YckC